MTHFFDVAFLLNLLTQRALWIRRGLASPMLFMCLLGIDVQKDGLFPNPLRLDVKADPVGAANDEHVCKLKMKGLYEYTYSLESVARDG